MSTQHEMYLSTMAFLWMLVLMSGHLAAIENTGTIDFESEEVADIPDAVYTSDAPVSSKDTKAAIEPHNDYLANKMKSLVLEQEAEKFVDPQYGIVLQFLTVFLRRGDTRDKDDSLTVYHYKQDFYRVCLWIFSLLAMLGNMGVLVYRLCLEAEGSSLAFRVLVANLCGSDFLMGVYLMMIGSADDFYSEVSAFMICIITLDRLLVLWFPLKRHLHLTWRSALVACSAAWLTGIVLAVVPLLPATGWEFYSQTGICLPLPVTRLQFPGKQYAFGTFIVLNFVLFLLIGIGQVFIYRAVRSTPLADRTNRRQQDMAIARRLLLIVFSDFCCWFPVGVMGLLASQDTPIPGEVNVAAAIFVLPLNSAINPFLYTLNMLLERRRKRKTEELLQTMMGRLHVEMRTWPMENISTLKVPEDERKI
nr:hypothetical protein BaRGS_008514 [Batillaria attramentaria]